MTDHKIVLQGITQLGPLALPPSITWKRDANWDRRFNMAQCYLYGRMDMGETRNANDNYRFAQAWADAGWEYDCQSRMFMRNLQSSLELWDERRETMGRGWL